jgi:hypothetical protein
MQAPRLLRGTHPTRTRPMLKTNRGFHHRLILGRTRPHRPMPRLRRRLQPAKVPSERGLQPSLPAGQLRDLHFRQVHRPLPVRPMPRRHPSTSRQPRSHPRMLRLQKQPRSRRQAHRRFLTIQIVQQMIARTTRISRASVIVLPSVGPQGPRTPQSREEEKITETEPQTGALCCCCRAYPLCLVS